MPACMPVPTRQSRLATLARHCRATFLVAACLGATLAASGASAQSVAITFDDGPTLRPSQDMNPQQRNQALLAALAKHQVKSVLYVTAGNGADKPAGYALAKAWGDAGHALGNHTMTHPDLDLKKVTLAQYQQEILACDKIIRTLPGYQKWFRFTFLHTGNTPEKSEGMKRFLREHDYRNAPVDLNTRDWEFDDQLWKALARSKGARRDAAVDDVRSRYLALVRYEAMKGRANSQPQVLLLHHNMVNAYWLDDVIQIFKDAGYAINPATAADVAAL